MLTEIKAEPYDFPFDAEHAALMIIDMQRDFLEPGGFGATLGNDVSLLRAIVPTLQRLLTAARRCGMTVIHTREGHEPSLADCPNSKLRRGQPKLRIGDVGPLGRVLVRGEPGHAIIPELAPIEGELVIDKPGKGSFWSTPLHGLLQDRGIAQLLVTGVTTEVCVQSTLREANDRGYDCLLIEDATESYFPAFKQATLEMVRAQGGIVGWTARADAVLSSLLMSPSEDAHG